MLHFQQTISWPPCPELYLPTRFIFLLTFILLQSTCHLKYIAQFFALTLIYAIIYIIYNLYIIYVLYIQLIYTSIWFREVCFQGTVSPFILGWPRTHHVGHDGLRFTETCLTLPTLCWIKGVHSGFLPSCFFLVISLWSLSLYFWFDYNPQDSICVGL